MNVVLRGPRRSIRKVCAKMSECVQRGNGERRLESVEDGDGGGGGWKKSCKARGEAGTETSRRLHLLRLPARREAPQTIDHNSCDVPSQHVASGE